MDGRIARTVWHALNALDGVVEQVADDGTEVGCRKGQLRQRIRGILKRDPLLPHEPALGGQQRVHARIAGDDHILGVGILQHRFQVGFGGGFAAASDQLLQGLEVVLVIVLALRQILIHLRKLLLMLPGQAEHGDLGLIAVLPVGIHGDHAEQEDGHHRKDNQADVGPEERDDGFVAYVQKERIQGFFHEKGRRQGDHERRIGGCSGHGASFFDLDQQLQHGKQGDIGHDDADKPLYLHRRKRHMCDLRQQLKDGIGHHRNHVEEQRHDDQPVYNGCLALGGQRERVDGWENIEDLIDK